MANEVKIIVTAKDQASGVLQGVGKALGNLSSTALSFAIGQLVADGIGAISNAVVGLGRTALDAYASNERLGMSLETLVAKEIANTSGVEKAIVVGQQRVELTKKEQAELDKLKVKIGDETTSRAQLAERIRIEQQELSNLENADKKNETAIARKKLQIEGLQTRYSSLNEEIGKHQTRITELTAKSEKYVNITKTVTEGQISVNEAMAQAGPRAQELVDWIQKLAILSPFDSEGVSQALKTAMAYGFTSEEAQKLTQVMIDFAAGSGQSSDVMGRIALALGQIKARGKLAAQEVNQLTEAGISVRQILAKAFGVTTGELEDMISNGLIPADKAIDAITDSLGKDFAGAAERQATSFSGLMTSLEEIKTIGLREFFTSTFQAIQPYLADFVNTMSSPETLAKLREWGDILGQNVAQGLAWAKENLPPVVEGFKTLLSYLSTGDTTAFEGLVSKLTDLFGPEIGAGLASLIARIREMWEAIKAGDPEAFKTALQGAINIATGVAGSLLGQLTGAIKTELQNHWPEISRELSTWPGRFWNWLTGPGGALGFAGTELGKVTAAIITWASSEDTKKQISDTLNTWGGMFWNWLQTSVIPYATERLNTLTEAIQDWVKSDKTKQDLNNLGEQIGKGIVGAIKGLFEKGETTEPVIKQLVVALVKAAVTSATSIGEIGGQIGGGMVEGIIEEITGAEVSEQLSGAIERVIRTIINTLNPVAMIAESVEQAQQSFSTAGNLLGYATGGVVPGPAGMPQLAVVHGGEQIVPAGQSESGGITITVGAIYANSYSEGQSAARGLVAELRARGYTV